MVYTYDQFETIKDAFFKKHHHDFVIETSPMDQYGVYHKEYYFNDGAVWYERYSPEYRKTEFTANIEGVTIKKTENVKLFCTEAWNTDNSKSIFLYELF